MSRLVTGSNDYAEIEYAVLPVISQLSTCNASTWVCPAAIAQAPDVWLAAPFAGSELAASQPKVRVVDCCLFPGDDDGYAALR
jgi:hypothetical protein